MNCRYVARDSPRIIPGRHTDDCPREACNGCQPCEERHCRVCGCLWLGGGSVEAA